MIDINKLDEDELQKLKEQIKSRELVIKNKKREEQKKKSKEKIRIIADNTIFTHVIEHRYSDCDDKKIMHGFLNSECTYSICPRCLLLEVNNGLVDEDDINIQVVLEVEEYEK